MKRRSFFRSLIAAPFAAVGAVVIAPVLAKPVTTKPLGELAVKIGCDISEFEAGMALVGKRMQEIAAKYEDLAMRIKADLPPITITLDGRPIRIKAYQC